MSRRLILFAMSALLALSFFASSAMASHEHPIGGSPIRVPLVPAFEACTSANSTHGLPLNFPSCNPPVPVSTTVKAGTGSVGQGWVVVCNTGSAVSECNTAGGGGFTTAMQPDVRLYGAGRDVQCRLTGSPLGCSAGSDYNPNGSPGPTQYTTTCSTAALCSNNGRPNPFCAPGGAPNICAASADITETAELGAPSGSTVDPTAECGTVATCLAFAGHFVGHAIRVTDHYNCDPLLNQAGSDPNRCPANATRNNRPATMIDILFPVPVDCLRPRRWPSGPSADPTRPPTRSCQVP